MKKGNRPRARVVVTGIGAVTSIGTGREAFWKNLLAGTSGVSPVGSFDTSEFLVHIGGEIHGFAPEHYMKTENVPLYGRSSLFGIAATGLALEDAAIEPDAVNEVESAVIIGTTMGESDVQETMVRTILDEGFAQVKLSDIKRLSDSGLAMNIAHERGLDADCTVIPTACAAGNYAIGHGYDLIRTGRAEIVIAGGCDAFSRASYAGFGRMLALAPEKCQPFDKNRKGIVIGEGAGIVVLESLEHAASRGARGYAEVLGYALSCDAHHMTIPHVDGIAAVMEKALRETDIASDEVGAICAHGTGTLMNDKTESEAIHRVFGKRARDIPVNSIKSMLGHTMGAASALEAIASILTLHEGRIPPTINFETPDEECDIDCVPNQMRELAADVILNNSFAFGANNATTVFSRLDPGVLVRAV